MPGIIPFIYHSPGFAKPSAVIRLFKRYSIHIVLMIGLSFISARAPSATYQLIIFEGSDWCRNCIRLDKTILSEDRFKEFIETNDIQLERIDFPQRKKLDESVRAYNASIAEKYQFSGRFPTILLVQPETDEVSEIEYDNETTDQFLYLLSTQIRKP